MLSLVCQLAEYENSKRQPLAFPANMRLRRRRRKRPLVRLEREVVPVLGPPTAPPGRAEVRFSAASKDRLLTTARSRRNGRWVPCRSRVTGRANAAYPRSWRASSFRSRVSASITKTLSRVRSRGYARQPSRFIWPRPVTGCGYGNGLARYGETSVVSIGQGTCSLRLPSSCGAVVRSCRIEGLAGTVRGFAVVDHEAALERPQARVGGSSMDTRNGGQP